MLAAPAQTSDRPHKTAVAAGKHKDIPVPTTVESFCGRCGEKEEVAETKQGKEAVIRDSHCADMYLCTQDAWRGTTSNGQKRAVIGGTEVSVKLRAKVSRNARARF